MLKTLQIIFVVIYSATTGLCIGFVVSFVLSEFFFRVLGFDLGDAMGVILLGTPTLGCVYLGVKKFLEKNPLHR